ncbi:fimbrial protein [Serratia fonticola]|uniref:fimbrial protein n=1 Tax=Serratia fonticola TaxID=47917 RepID=UPI0009398C38|nr:fimbrial protein [Serratia fonticola]OKP16859.1 fimbrial protein [Serratia fonticola]
MKIKLISLALVAFSSVALADSANTVQFKGEVSEQTCNVNINGNEGNPIVLLPTVPAADLASPGATAGATEFTVNVTGCNVASSDTAIKTVFAGNNPTANGNLGNAGDAQNVSIQLMDSNGTTPLVFATSTTVTTSPMTLQTGATSTSQTLSARYYAEGIATPGAVLATAQYAISYN